MGSISSWIYFDNNSSLKSKLVFGVRKFLFFQFSSIYVGFFYCLWFLQKRVPVVIVVLKFYRGEAIGWERHSFSSFSKSWITPRFSNSEFIGTTLICYINFIVLLIENWHNSDFNICKLPPFEPDSSLLSSLRYNSSLLIFPIGILIKFWISEFGSFFLTITAHYIRYYTTMNITIKYLFLIWNQILFNNLNALFNRVIFFVCSKLSVTNYNI